MYYLTNNVLQGLSKCYMFLLAIFCRASNELCTTLNKTNIRRIKVKLTWYWKRFRTSAQVSLPGFQISFEKSMFELDY